MIELTYTKEDLPIILRNIENAMEDLEEWNAHNDNTLVSEISVISEILSNIVVENGGSTK